MKIRVGTTFLAILMMGLLVGCARSASPEESFVEESNFIADKISDADKSEKAEALPDGEKTEEETSFSAAEIEISDKNVQIDYAGEDFVKSAFAAGGTTLYVCGIKTDGTYFLGQMQREEELFQEFDVNMEEDMRVILMAVGRQEKCHILWMSVEQFERDGQAVNRINFEKSYITVVDNSGKLEKEIDVSEIFLSEKLRPFCFAVDGQGNYYFEKEKELIQVTSEGKKGNTAVCEGWIEGIGTGKSGMVYCTYRDESGEAVLARLEENNLQPCGAKLPKAQAAYAGVYPGTDSELLILNKESGVFACDGEKAEVRISAAELPVTGERIAGYGVLSDGRACIMAQEDGASSFYYIPAGK